MSAETQNQLPGHIFQSSAFVIQSFCKLFQKDKVQNLQTSDEPQNPLPGHMFQRTIVHLPPHKKNKILYTLKTLPIS